MVSTRERLSEIGPIKRGQYSMIAKQLGVTRERIRQIVAPTPCPRCGGYKGNHSKICRKCRWEQHRVTVSCAECGIPVTLEKSRADGSRRHFCKGCWGTLTAAHRYDKAAKGLCPQCGHRDQLQRFKQSPPKIRRDGGKP